MVAGEIHKLAAETTLNSKLITDIIGTNDEEIRTTIRRGTESREQFVLFREWISAMKVTLNEIEMGLSGRARIFVKFRTRSPRPSERCKILSKFQAAGSAGSPTRQR